jgi:uncharacterized protein YbjT (DUF2867 family)
MRLLMLGGTGFVGRAVVDLAVERGGDVDYAAAKGLSPEVEAKLSAG